MFASRMLLRAPGPALFVPIQFRAFSLARISLEPAKRAPPPPPPAPVSKAAVKAKPKAAPAPAVRAKTPVRAASKKAVVVPPPVVKRRVLTDKERTAKMKAKEKAAAVKEREKVRKAAAKEKEKEKERAAKIKAKEKERATKLKEKEREQAKKLKEKEIQMKKTEKPYPLPPRRPRTAFLFFYSDMLKGQNPTGESAPEVAHRVGEAWRALPNSDKERYMKQADAAREQFNADVAKWLSSLNLAELTAARRNREPGTRGDTAISALPRRPGNAFALFLKEAIARPDVRERIDAAAKKEANGDPNVQKRLMIGLFGKTSGTIWKAMSDKEKMVYQNRAANAKKDWEKNFGALIATQQEAHSATA